jgi:hypothetical protein
MRALLEKYGEMRVSEKKIERNQGLRMKNWKWRNENWEWGKKKEE